jgi:hypothetical protein
MDCIHFSADGARLSCHRYAVWHIDPKIETSYPVSPFRPEIRGLRAVCT